MSFALNNKLVLGIYGDGQLARLLALQARLYDFEIVIYTLSASQSPCQDVADSLVEAKSWDDQNAFDTFVNKIDVLTLENEFVPAEFLFRAEAQGKRCFPNAACYHALSDKLKQVRLAESLDIKIPNTQLINDVELLSRSEFPIMLKALKGGYDGYGNFLFAKSSDFEAAKSFLKKAGPALAQELISFDMEVAVMVVRAPKQKAKAFPVVETIQENNICHCTLTPARMNEQLLRAVQNEACKIIDKLDGVGLFGIEFFIRGSDIIFNEIAPRPHNSGHLSMEACNISQFQSLALLAGKHSVPNPTLTVPSAGMLNLLGTRNGPAHFTGEGFRSAPKGFLHLYGKKESRLGRKMGHYTLIGNGPEEILKELDGLKSRYQI